MLPLMTPDREPFTPDAGPAPAVWPLFGLRLVAQDLDLRAAREHDAVALAALLPDDVELDPDNPRPGLGEGPEGRAAMALQTMWRMWAGWTPQRWALPFAVRVRGELVGMQVLEGTDFAVLRTVDSASWLVPPARGRGTGRRMREAVLAFAFGSPGRPVRHHLRVVRQRGSAGRLTVPRLRGQRGRAARPSGSARRGGRHGAPAALPGGLAATGHGRRPGAGVRAVPADVRARSGHPRRMRAGGRARDGHDDYGYFLSSEEFTPGASSLEQARLAEQAGFDALWISTTSTRGTTSRARARSCGR